MDVSNITQLTPKDMAVHHTAWRVSPDGQTIAFAAMGTHDGQYSAGKYAVYTVNVDGRQLTQLTGYDYVDIGFVGWVPHSD
ncbi:MAG TPA: hypothetical protein P5526_15120 [Anaerolineae bacterium]|nr:hypothetical protein [Anaerolineae bacterium]